jgi:hypothetical protein
MHPAILSRSRRLKALLCGLAMAHLSLTATAVLAEKPAAAGFREHGAHVHGVGSLNVALEGDALLIELISPAMDLVGFEHPPRTAEQQARLDQARARLAQPGELFAPNPEADCRLIETEIALDLDAAPHEHKHEHEHDHAVHADAYASYGFECLRPSALRALSVGYFQAFPRAQKLRVQVISETRQAALELTRSDRQLAF